MTPQVTCVIPVRNGAATIERAVKSAIDAHCESILVYDDFSTDNTYEVLQSMLSKYPAMEIIHGPEYHVGVNFARNCMIDYANDDDLIICLDADDELYSFMRLFTFYDPNTFVYGNHKETDGQYFTEHKGAPIGTLANKMVSGVTFLFAKSDWKKVGGFDPDFSVCEDWAFQCALVNAGVQGKYIDEMVYFRYIRPEGNIRTTLAGQYWHFYRDMARRKYPSVFAGTG